MIKKIQKWINWVLKEDNLKIVDFEKDLKDGIIFVHLAMKLTKKKTKFNKIDASKTSRTVETKKRENFQIALDLFRSNGYTKEVQGVSAEDFEKDEDGDMEKIDYTPVLGLVFFLHKLFLD